MSALRTLTAVDLQPRDEVVFSYGMIVGTIMFAVVASIFFRRSALARQAADQVARHTPYTELLSQLEECVTRMARLVELHGEFIARVVDLREDELTPRRDRHDGG